jgi:HSP20 family molecular chaperone IbpA
MCAVSTTQSDKGFKIVVVSAKDQMARIQGVITHDALSGTAGSNPDHKLETWRDAKSELVRELRYGMMIRDEDIRVETDTEEFKKGTVEIWVSPRYVTICGEPRSWRTGKVVEGCGSKKKCKILFRALDLPVDVEPSGVTAKLSGPILEIYFRKAHGKKDGAKASTASFQ